MEFKIKIFDFLPYDALSLRITVFVDEQGFIDEVDNIDKTATHLVLYNENNLPLATCRVFESEDGGHYILGRLCVLKEYRGSGLGSALLAKAEETVKNMGGSTLSLHSQYQAREFYKKSGYTEYGELEYEQNCPHIWLKKELN